MDLPVKLRSFGHAYDELLITKSDQCCVYLATSDLVVCALLITSSSVCTG